MDFDESRLAKPSDWDDLADANLDSSMAALASEVDASFEETKREIAAEKAKKKQQKALAKAATPCIIDTHVHLWSSDALPPWLADDASLQSIAKTRSIADYTQEAPSVTQCVYMEVDVAPADRAREAEAVIALVRDPSNRLCGAVIGAPVVDGSIDDFAQWLTKWGSVDAVKGVRQVLHPQPHGTCMREDIVAKAKLAGEAGLVFELCLRADDLASADALAAAAPGTRFVLDHAGGHHQLKAETPTATRDAWRAGIEQLSKRPNVFCKLSGLLGAQGGASGGGGVAGWSAASQRETVLFCLKHFR